ncbi:hypothetical protein [Chamaesiphon minutus]|uniref:Uncharacterized protein n=1 Tax=Chamaesiphon minutus (strain ATCC 27169 / PCC 6605) TaxID=1173020 RepID=K9UEJ2_CHAP6|nr:hypothetical protein [Chamaesiphon minutus]AFY92826.1 hypothetical protein Cha6605_1693 [Chamaesiphon minutus PCC 6605]
MKPSTLKCLLTAIALPLFTSTLSLVAPVSAEQIARSRSITARESNSEDPVPSVTDLNLSVPIDRQDSSAEIPIRSDSSPNRSTTSSNSKRSQSSISIQNAVTTAPSLKVKSSSSRNSTVAAELATVNAKITGASNKLQSNSNRRIAAVSPSPFRGNYLRLVKDPSNRTNDLGNPIHILEVYRNGIIYQRFKATSGTAGSQNRDRSLPDIAAPLQDGLYTVNGQIVPGTIPEVGKTFIAVFPRFETARTDLGIHFDPSFNKRNCDFRHKLAQSSTINWLRNNENTSFQAIDRIEFSIITWH